MQASYEQLISARSMIVKIIWGAMLMQLFVFFAILFIIIKPEESTPTPIATIMQEPQSMIFVAIAAALAAISYFSYDFVLNRMRRNRMSREQILSKMENARGKYGHKVYSDNEMNLVRTFDEAKLGKFWLVTRSLPIFIVRFALCDAIALLGFLLATQYGNQQVFVPFGAVAIVLMLTYFPRDVA